jgi:hypothetical protein
MVSDSFLNFFPLAKTYYAKRAQQFLCHHVLFKFFCVKVNRKCIHDLNIVIFDSSDYNKSTDIDDNP